jgi:hypothetical protein
MGSILKLACWIRVTRVEYLVESENGRFQDGMMNIAYKIL